MNLTKVNEFGLKNLASEISRTNVIHSDRYVPEKKNPKVVKLTREDFRSIVRKVYGDTWNLESLEYELFGVENEHIN